MAVNQHPASVMVASHAVSEVVSDAAPAAAPDRRATARNRKARSLDIPRLIVDACRIRSKVGVAAAVILLSGAILAFVCTFWAVRQGVPYPLAIMAGYCTLVGGACLFTTLLVVHNLTATADAASAARQPNYAAWRLVSRLSVSDASRLWCDIEPGCAATQESIAWAFAMLDAIKLGDLPFVERAHTDPAAAGRERSNPTWHTEVTRDALKAWAQAHGHAPRFLQD